MNWFLKILLIIGFAYQANAVSCYSCNDNNFDGESNYPQTCFFPQSSTATTTCAANQYCRTQLIIRDGVPTEVNRGCGNPASDHDAHSNNLPSATKCQTEFDVTSDPTGKTTCYFSCNTTDCNSHTIGSLKTCTSSCNIVQRGGACDYISGKCVCNGGYGGDHCNITQTLSTAKRKCVQCTSVTDSACKDSTDAQDCPNNEGFCTTTQTSLIDSANMEKDNPVITKGCTASFVATNQCFFTDIFSDSPINNGGRYKEYTCVSTCDTDGCNNKVADGKNSGTGPLQCAVCSDLTGSGSCNPGAAGAEKRQSCPSGSTHCKSTVTYFVSDKTDLRYNAEPSYTLRSVVRECASGNSEEKKCEESAIGSLSLKKVVCTETCDFDGCNNKWPNRPSCVQCSTSTDVGCILTPPAARTCGYPYHKYCVIEDSGMTHKNSTSILGFPRSTSRRCSATNITTGCTTKEFRGVKIDSCNFTCIEDGCNVGFQIQTDNAATTTTHYSVVVLLFAIIGSFITM